MEHSYEYTKKVVADSQQEVVQQLEYWMGELTTLHHKEQLVTCEKMSKDVHFNNYTFIASTAATSGDRLVSYAPPDT
jgi:hypothetical protein